MSGIMMISVGNSYGYKPVNTVAPVVSGTATVGQTLTTTNGTWDAAPAAITYTYQWQRNTSNIGGATNNTYVLQTADIGNTVRCVVTATNAVGVTSANSNSTATVQDVFWIAQTSLSINSARMTLVSSSSSAGAYGMLWSEEQPPYRLLLNSFGAITGTSIHPGNDGSMKGAGPFNQGSIYNNYGEVNALSDTSNGDYWTAGRNEASGGNTDMSFARFNSAGTRQWFKRIGRTGLIANTQQLARKSNGNIVSLVSNRSESETYDYRAFFYEFDGSGNIVGSARDFSGSDNYGAFALSIDSSNNVVWAKNMRNGNNWGYIAKVDSSFTNGVWATQVRPASTSHLTQFQGTACSGLDVIATGVYSYGTGQQEGLVIRFNSSGGVSWGRRLVISAENLRTGTPFIDASGNIWVTTCASSSSTNRGVYIIKLNSSGNLLFKRKIVLTGNYGTRFTSVSVTGSTAYINAAITTPDNVNNSDLFMFKLPADGSRTGTYGIYTYSDPGELSVSTDMSPFTYANPSPMPGYASATPSESTTPNTNTTFSPTVVSLTTV